MIRIIGYFRLLIRLNILKTLYFNIKVFDWNDAIKIPVYFFGPVKFANLSGKILIKATDLTRGMIQFGCEDENVLATNEPIRISVSGTLIFRGRCEFSKGIQLLVWNKGTLDVGMNAWFGSFTKIVSFQSMHIGNDFMSSWECQLFDTDFHFIKDTKANKIPDNTSPVKIGNQVWLGSRVTLLKGTHLPDKCIVAVGSICNKNYSTIYSSNIIIGGCPAKLIKEGAQYVKAKSLEKELYQYFQADRNRNGVYDLDI